MFFWRTCLSQRRQSERIEMPSLIDNPDATGNTQDLEMSGSHRSIKREGSRGVEGPRQLPRTVSRTKAAARRRSQRIDDNGTQGPGGRQGGRAEDPQQDPAQSHSQNASDDETSHQRCGTRCWSRLRAQRRTTCRSRLQPTQRKSDKRGKDTRGPPFVWAYLGLVKSLQQRRNASGARTAQGRGGTKPNQTKKTNQPTTNQPTTTTKTTTQAVRRKVLQTI